MRFTKGDKLEVINPRAKRQPQKDDMKIKWDATFRDSLMILRRTFPYGSSIVEAAQNEQVRKFRAIEKDGKKQRVAAAQVIEKGNSWMHVAFKGLSPYSWHELLDDRSIHFTNRDNICGDSMIAGLTVKKKSLLKWLEKQLIEKFGLFIKKFTSLQDALFMCRLDLHSFLCFFSCRKSDYILLNAKGWKIISRHLEDPVLFGKVAVEIFASSIDKCSGWVSFSSKVKLLPVNDGTGFTIGRWSNFMSAVKNTFHME